MTREWIVHEVDVVVIEYLVGYMGCQSYQMGYCWGNSWGSYWGSWGLLLGVIRFV